MSGALVKVQLGEAPAHGLQVFVSRILSQGYWAHHKEE